MYQKIAWHEGMLLEPQHFQQQDRHVEYLMRQNMRLYHRYYWGFIELDINEELLSIGKFGLKRVKAVFPDGSIYNAPDVDELPAIIDIPDNIKPQAMLLALPLSNTPHDKISFDSHTKKNLRYIAKSLHITDHTANNENTAIANIAALHPTLVLDENCPSECSTLTIAKIIQKSKDNRVDLDQQFIPALLDALKNIHLKSLIQELLDFVTHRIQILSKPLQGLPLNSASLDVIMLFILQRLNDFLIKLFHYSQQSHFHPESLYLLLISSYHEISTLTEASHSPKVFAPYQHANIREVIYPLCDALRTALKEIWQQPVTEISLSPQNSGTWLARLDEPNLFKNTTMILAVYADIPIKALQNTFPKQMKIASPENIQNLINRSLPGIDLQLLPVVPRQIPHQANYSYFLLEPNHPEWHTVATSQTLFFHLSGKYPEISLELWAIRGNR